METRLKEAMRQGWTVVLIGLLSTSCVPMPQIPEQVTQGATATTTAASETSVNAWSKKPAQVERPDVKRGDTWSYVRTDAPRMGQITIQEVVAVSAEDIIVRSTEKGGPGFAMVLCDRDWNPITIGSWQYSPHLTSFSFPLKQGKRWKQNASATVRGITGRIHSKGKVIGWEQVTVPAGRFDALKVQVERTYTGVDRVGAPSTTTDTFWYVPDVKKNVKFTLEQFREDRLLHINRLELVEYKVN